MGLSRLRLFRQQKSGNGLKVEVLPHDQYACYDIVLLAKGDPELKAKLLFQFYDIHEDNVVSY